MTVQGKGSYVRFRPEYIMENPKFKVGLLFDDKNIIKRVVHYYRVKTAKIFDGSKNDTGRMRAQSKTENCKWFIYASEELDSDVFIIWTIGSPCNCGRIFYHKCANSGFLAVHYMDFLRLNKQITRVEFKKKVYLELNVNITMDQMSKTKLLIMRANLLINGKVANHEG